jgi:hypothetical protein
MSSITRMRIGALDIPNDRQTKEGEKERPREREEMIPQH